MTITVTSYRRSLDDTDDVVIRWTTDLTGVHHWDVHQSTTQPIPIESWSKMTPAVGDTPLRNTRAGFPSAGRWVVVRAMTSGNALIEASAETWVPGVPGQTTVDPWHPGDPTDGPAPRTVISNVNLYHKAGETLTPVVILDWWTGGELLPLSEFNWHVVTPYEPPPESTTGGPTVTAMNTGVPSGQSLTTVAWNNSTHGTSAGTLSTPLVFENMDFTTTGNPTITGSHKRFVNCRWTGRDVITRNNTNVHFTNCEAGKFTVSSAKQIEYHDIKSLPTIGIDGFGVTSDSGYMCEDILVDGFWCVGTEANLIGGSGNHYDCIQIRGVNGLTMKNMVLDQGTAFDVLFNATLFLENANGGNSNVLIEQVYSRAAGYNHFYFFASNFTLRNVVLAPLLSGQHYVYNTWTAPTLIENVRTESNVPVSLTPGA